MQTSHFESVRFHSSDISQVVLYVLIVVDIYLVPVYRNLEDTEYESFWSCGTSCSMIGFLGQVELPTCNITWKYNQHTYVPVLVTSSVEALAPVVQQGNSGRDK